MILVNRPLNGPARPIKQKDLFMWEINVDNTTKEGASKPKLSVSKFLEKIQQPLDPEAAARIERENEVMMQEELMMMEFRWYTSLSKRDAETKTWKNLEITEPELKEAADSIRSWSPELGIGLFIYGEPGNGKTHMMKALIQDHYSRETNFLFRTCSDVLNSFKDFENREYYHAELLKPWGLVLDDFGTEKATDYEQEQLFRLIEHRKELGKFIFMTSNLNFKDLQEKYNKRIVSRLGEHMSFVENKAKSYRRKIFQRNQEALRKRRLKLAD